MTIGRDLCGNALKFKHEPRNEPSKQERLAAWFCANIPDEDSDFMDLATKFLHDFPEVK